MTADLTAESVKRLTAWRARPWPHNPPLKAVDVVIAALQAAEQECERLKAECALGDMRASYDDLMEQHRSVLADLRASEAQVAALEEALRRIAQATPRNTNSSSAESMASWTYAVATSALDYPAALSAVPPSQGVEKPDMRKVVEALGFEPDNHHNALKCPYCTPEIAAPEPRSNNNTKKEPI